MGHSREDDNDYGAAHGQDGRAWGYSSLSVNGRFLSMICYCASFRSSCRRRLPFFSLLINHCTTIRRILPSLRTLEMHYYQVGNEFWQ